MSIDLRALLSASTPEGETVRLLVIGSAEGVMEVMQTLHSLGYAEVRAWGPIQPIPERGEFMSVLTRRRTKE
jgi:hypothetical protein